MTNDTASAAIINRLSARLAEATVGALLDEAAETWQEYAAAVDPTSVEAKGGDMSPAYRQFVIQAEHAYARIVR